MSIIIVITAVMAWAVISDWRWRVIPNWVSVCLAVLYLASLPLIGPDAQHVFNTLLLAAVGFGFGLLLYSLGIMGGGDGKLMAASLLWVGSDNAIVFLLFTALLGGLLAVFFLLRPWWQRQSASASTGQGLPYALAIAPAALLCLGEPLNWIPF